MTITENNDETVPISTSPEPVQEIPIKKRRRWWLVLVCVLIILVGAGVGAFFGYRAGLNDRIEAENDQRVAVAATQFTLGLADLDAGRYETARKRFEYVISIDPGYPGVADKLAEAMLLMAQALTPTPEPLPTASPTPDLRNEEQLFNQIKQDLASKSWAAAIANIEALRNLNLEYHAVDVDGMYYIALRFLGIENILNQGQLEVGIYNLTLAERFAPIDQDAKNYRNWARQYIYAASFWGVDWAQVVAYFADIYPALPNLRDSSHMTATERFRIASIKYGDQLMAEEKYCDAQIQYQNAQNVYNDPVVQPTAQTASDFCANPPGQPEEPTPTETPTPTPTGSVVPTDAITPTETPTSPVNPPETVITTTTP